MSLEPEDVQRLRGFLPDGCQGLYNARFEALGSGLFQDRNDQGKFPFRTHFRDGLWPLVLLVRSWRSDANFDPPFVFPQIQYGFVRNGGTPLVDPSFRLFDALEAFNLGAPLWKDSYTDYTQAVPETDGQPWEFFVRNERIGEAGPYDLRCEVMWTLQPTARFRG